LPVCGGLATWTTGKAAIATVNRRLVVGIESGA
jgi:hypothetical protein